MVREISRGRPMPQTDAFILLGTVHRLSFKSEGGIYVQKWGRTSFDSDMGYEGARAIQWKSKPPQLFWSRKAKALYVFPRKNPVKGWRRGAAADTADSKLFREWNRGANVHDRSVEVDFPEPRLFKQGRAFDIVYRSPKWDGDMDSYHHDFSGGPSLYASQGVSPSAFVVQGGRLTVNDRGIIY